ncbi:MAG: hypothetical protein ABUS51_10670 [Acidobacteriota bacterium]
MPRLPGIFAGAMMSVAASAAAGCLMAPGTPLPRAVRFATGAVLFSACVFALLACGLGYRDVYLAVAALMLAGAWRACPTSTVALPRLSWFVGAVLAVYGLFYLVFAMAPEIQPDALAYHLRLVSDYARLHAFSNHIAFYDVLPQGMEMLYVPAFAVGGAAAAKLVHFTFLIATVPLLREIAREAGLHDQAGSAAAAVFFLAPVCGVAGTAAYTDAGLVCAVCAVLYLTLRWDRERTSALLLCAALNAGFCYAVKPTFGWVVVAATAYVGMRARRIAPAAGFAALALLVVLPWMARAYWLSGNPVAPFANGWFPNPVATPDLEKRLAASYSAFRTGFPWRTVWTDYTVAGGHQGLLGAAFLLLPLALLSLRQRAGRWLLAAAALLAVPVLANTGTRFLLPAMAPASLALASVLPGPLVIGLVALQAIGAAPPVMDLYDKRHEWRLGALPVRAALGTVPEAVYLKGALPGYAVARMVARNTGADAKIFACSAVPEAYIPREILIWWHSAEARRFTDALHFAHMSRGTRARVLSWRWNAGEYRSLRLTALTDLRVVEAGLVAGSMGAQSWKMFHPGEAIRLTAGPGVRGADLLIWPGDQAREKTEALPAAGSWLSMDARAERCARNIDLRRDATAYIRRSGYHYILIPVEADAFAEIGSEMGRHPGEWGVEAVGRADTMWLFRIIPDLM